MRNLFAASDRVQGKWSEDCHRARDLFLRIGGVGDVFGSICREGSIQFNGKRELVLTTGGLAGRVEDVRGGACH